MVSEMAIEDIAELAEKGVVLSPREVVRLNALGVQAEHNERSSSFFALPRCAILGSVVFREPTIGHELWLDNLSRLFDSDDILTEFALRAYACATPLDEMPDWADVKAVVKAVSRFVRKRIGKFTRREVVNCVNYCQNGNDANLFEAVATDDGDAVADESFSAAAGVVREGQSIGLGISLADAVRMTRSEMQAVVGRAYAMKGIPVDESVKQKAIGDYYKTLDEIKKTHGVN